MNDNEIIKALECCFLSECTCKDCPYSAFEICDTAKMINTVIDLINRQKAEIERLKDKYECIYQPIAEVKRNSKAEAYKEFVERLKDKGTSPELDGCKYFNAYDIEKTLTELTERKEDEGK